MSKETSGVFDYKVVATVKDRTYTSAFRNAIYKALVGSEGVSNQIGNKLSASDISDGVDLKVRLLDGVAFVAGATYRLYDEGSGNSKDLAIDSEQVGLDRIDLIVLEFSSLDVDRIVIAKIVKGLPGVIPNVPSLIQSGVEDAKGIYQIALHQVVITGGNKNAVVVTDVRPFYNDLRQQYINVIAEIVARESLIEDDSNDTIIKSNNIEKIRVKDTGSVGIGTIAPDDVNGITFSFVKLNAKNTANRARVVIDGNGAAELLLNDQAATLNQRIKAIASDNNKLILRSHDDNGTARDHITIDNAGNIGTEGITNPESVLHIKSQEIGTGANKGIIISNNTDSQRYSIRTGIVGVTNSILSIYDETAAANRIAINTSGDVGIGTHNMTAKLHVNGNVIGDVPIADNHLTPKLYVDDAAGAELEDFGAAGLQITTDTDQVNATSISTGLPSKYTHFILEVGQSDIDSIYIEVPNNLTSAVPGNRIIEDKRSITEAFEATYAKFFIDGTTLKGYYARSNKWTGNEEDDALFGTSLVEVYKVWGVVR